MHKPQNKSYSVDELKHFMQLGKLQVPTKRNVLKKDEDPECAEMCTVKELEDGSVKELEDGSVEITAVDIKPTSCGRERFGQGTKEWPKFPLEEEPIKKFFT